MTETKTPEAQGGVIPCLNLQGAIAAADFYKRAFGAEEAFRYPPDEKGRTMHIHLRINGNSVMLSDPFPEHGCGYQPFAGCVLHIQVADVDPVWQRAVDAGCEVVMPLQLMFWGDRYGQVRDPFGVTWSLASTPKS